MPATIPFYIPELRLTVFISPDAIASDVRKKYLVKYGKAAISTGRDVKEYQAKYRSNRKSADQLTSSTNHNPCKKP